MPGGRPSLIDATIDYRPDGTPITVQDRICAALRAGSYRGEAFRSAGLNRDTGYGYLQTAARVKLRARGGPIEALRPKPSAHELRCLAFSDAVEEADASWEIGALATLERLARGGIPQIKTVTKRGPDQADGSPGPILEKTVTEESTLPSAQVLEWRLERKFPDRYGRRVEITGAEGGPVALSIEERAADLAQVLDGYLKGIADAKAHRAPRKKKSAPVEVAAEPPAG